MKPKQTQAYGFAFFSSCPSCPSWVIIAVSILLLSSCASLELAPGKTPAPRAKFLQPIYDFGFAGPEQEITHTFRFTNTGSMPLTINKVSTGCGCTATLIPEQEILPGGQGEIRAVFETRRYEGKQEKQITVYSNDPETPEILLTLKGIVKRDVVVVPSGINFGKVDRGETAAKRIRLLQLSKNRLILEKVEGDDRYFWVKSSGFTEENSRGFEIEVILKPGVPAGKLNQVITLHTNVKRRPRIDIPVWGDVIE